MANMDTTSLMVGAVAGGVVGLSKDIIFSWLNIGRGEKNQPNPFCSDHREKLARIEERLDMCETELAKGSTRFQIVQETLERMNQTLAVLLDRSNRRRGVGDDNG